MKYFQSIKIRSCKVLSLKKVYLVILKFTHLGEGTLFNLIFIYLSHHAAYGILVPIRIESAPALEAWILNLWAIKEAPKCPFFKSRGLLLFPLQKECKLFLLNKTVYPSIINMER